MKDIALVVFDMAGTTIEDSGQVPEAFTTVLNRHGIAINDDTLRAVRGASKRDAIRHFVAGKHQTGVDALTDTIYTDFCDYLAQLFNAGGVKPMPGAADVFAWLRGQNIKIALNTGFDRPTADLIIDAVGWRSGVVDTVICGDDVTSGRPAPFLIFRSMEACDVTSVHKVMCVGDTVLDLQAGFNAGVRYVVGVLSGAHKKAQLEQERHTHLIESVASLPSMQF
ncbi:MAG TPA: phosphonatase-like hydrolase [Burkholderiales bacterium]|nr:phosphonatase-like hydrolase [Burkholderiales bacterium]